MKKFTGLGRGLDALIDTSHVDTNGGSSISEIEMSTIIANPDQPRSVSTASSHRSRYATMEMVPI